MNINLVPLNVSEPEYVYLMFQEIPAEEDGFENPAYGLSRSEFSDFCKKQVGHSRGENLKPGHVPDTYFLLYVNNNLVGFTKMRHFLNDFLRSHGGHIGYGIRPSCRGQGYGNIILAEVLKKARELKIEKALLTIRDYNIRSRRVCEHNGGKLDKIVPGTEYSECFYWIDLS